MAKTLVVYYSQSRGNTKKIAREIAFTMGADLADLKACAKGAKVIAQTDVQFDSTGGDSHVRRHRLGRKAEINTLI